MPSTSTVEVAIEPEAPGPLEAGVLLLCGACVEGLVIGIDCASVILVDVEAIANSAEGHRRGVRRAGAGFGIGIFAKGDLGIAVFPLAKQGVARAVFAFVVLGGVEGAGCVEERCGSGSVQGHRCRTSWRFPLPVVAFCGQSGILRKASAAFEKGVWPRQIVRFETGRRHG